MNDEIGKEIIERLTRLETSQDDMKTKVEKIADDSVRITRLEERQISNTRIVYGLCGAVGLLILEALKVFETAAINNLMGG